MFQKIKKPETVLVFIVLLIFQSPIGVTQDQKNPGFQGGQRTFSNPFVNEDTEEEEIPPQPSRNQIQNQTQSQRALPTVSAGGKKEDSDVPDPVITKKGVEIGGDKNDGIISNEDVPFLTVDTETGKGGKAIITDFNYPDADVIDLAKTMGKLVGKNFIFDKDVKGRITIVSNSPITVSDAWRAFLTSLDINGFTIIPSGKYLLISRKRDARDKQLSTYIGDYSPNTDILITRVFLLKYISADEVARTFRSFMPANSRIIPHDQTNTVIVTDTGSNIAKLAKMLEFLDVEGFDAGIEVIAVKYASADELAKLIDTLVPGQTAGASPRTRVRGRTGGNNFEARRTKEGGVINTIMADERTNSLIVHANSKGAEQIRELVKKLDQRVPQMTGGGKIHVIYLQFAEAEKIAETLRNLSQDSGASSRRSNGSRLTRGNPTDSSAALFEGDIKVSPDKDTNSLVVTASPSDFVTIQRVVAQLDIPRDEVYVEVIIMELQIGKNFTFSSNIINPASGLAAAPNPGDLASFFTNPFGSGGLLLGFTKGNKKEYDINGNKIQVSSIAGLVKALQTNAKANVLATPQILTLDNKEATFETSELIPIPTIQTANNGTTTSGITKEKVSLSIKIKPQINKASNFVKLDMNVKLADVSNRKLPAQVEQLAIATFERSADTSLVVADGDTVVIGGLVQDKSQETISKVPILGDIPILGWLFRSKSSETSKTNLMIFITPQIVRKYEKMRAILDQKLKQRDDFLRKNNGGEDPFREARDDMIRSLPEMQAIQSYHYENNLPALESESNEADKSKENKK